MKKVISLVLAVLMVMSVMAFAVSAIEIEEAPITGVCTCKDHDAKNACHCCVLCPNLDKSYLTACAKNTSADGGFDGRVCCNKCTGIWPCNCGCECCLEHDQDIDDVTGGPILSDDTQKDIVSAFQNILKQISDWFDNLFDAIFEFLRFDEIMGKN